MTTTKTNAREQLIAHVLDQGWELDPTNTVYANPRHWQRHDAERIQNPHAFIRPAADGGTWLLELDYTVRSNYYGVTDNRLRRVFLRKRDANGALAEIGKDSYNNSVVLHGRSADDFAGSLSYHFWVVLGGDSDSSALRQRAELLITNPDLATWLAEESRQQRLVRVAERNRRRQAELAARNRPLNITVERSEWDAQADALFGAANKLRGAHGLTDLPDLVAEAESALAALRAALPAH